MTAPSKTPEPVPQRQLLFGLYVDPLSMDAVIERCRTALCTRRQLLLGVVNAAKVVHVQTDALLRNSLLQCDLLLADGQSIVWASWLLGRPLPERVAGIDIFEQLLDLAHREERSVYLLGARPDVLEKLLAGLQIIYPGLRIAGSHHGYFDDGEGGRIAAEIRASGADMLFLGMVTPKKENFLAAHGSSLDVPVLHGVGGSFDVLAGVTRRAPLSWQRTGTEWAFRLLQEPRRMWWRYLTTNSKFLVLMARELLRPTPPFASRSTPELHFEEPTIGRW